jgi:hypothetical protein
MKKEDAIVELFEAALCCKREGREFDSRNFFEFSNLHIPCKRYNRRSILNL